MGTASVNTVLGPVSPDDLGITLMHEHIVFGFPGWYGDGSMGPFDRQATLDAALDTMDQLNAFGVKTFVDATPNDTGRDPELYKEVSEKSGMNIICSTGYYYEEAGGAPYFKFRSMFGDGTKEIYEMFMREITEGIENTGVKAGVIKLASSEGEITDYEKMFFRAAAMAQKETGIPIVTHTQTGSMGPEQAGLLIREGADPKRIMIGHMSDSLDIGYHLDVLNQGVYDGFDRMGIQGVQDIPMDIEKYDVMMDLMGKGHVSRMVISHDSVIHLLGRPLPSHPEQLKELMKNHHPTHLFRNIIPFLKKAGATDEHIKTIIEDNPRRFFGGD